MKQTSTAIISSLAVAIISVATAKEVAPQPAKADKPRIEVCFVLDTTGSMSGLIEGAKQKIWSIANEMISAKLTPEIRIGLVGYRDRGDEYVTKTFDLTNDIDTVYANLRQFSAGGGGDEPESVNEALNDAVTKLSWAGDKNVLKIIFLVGDAPPHMDYADGPKYPDVCQAAVKKDIVINTAQCGNIADTAPVWKKIAGLSEGSYVALAQSGNMVAVTTPMDEKLSELNRKLGTTLVAYGDVSVRREVAAKQIAAENAPASVAADRLAFNSKSGVAVQGNGELLDALAGGKVTLSSLKKDDLPAEMQKLDEAELKAEIGKKQKERADLQQQIQELSKDRDAYIAQEQKHLAESSKADSFDAKVAETIREQAAKKGIEYSK